MNINHRSRDGRSGEQRVQHRALEAAIRPREHPRLHRRRADVAREAGRRRLRVVLAVAACLALTGAVWGMSRSPLLDVDRATVAGAEHTGTDAVLAAAGIHRGRAMGDIDEAASARRIERLAWVQSAVVVRQWPGTVHVAVTERQPIAVTRTFTEQWGLVDATGRVLAEVPDRPAGLPWVAGPQPAGAPASRVDATTTALLPVARALPAGLAPRVSAIVGRDSQVELFLAPAGIVRLGPPESAPDRLGVADAILARTPAAAAVAIDARFPSTAVLTRA